MKLVAYWGTLIRLAKAEAVARQSGDEAAYAKAKWEHEAYRQICLEADEMILGTPVHAL